MNSYSGSNKIQSDSSFATKGALVTFDPTKILELKKIEILNLLSETDYSKEEINEIYSLMIEIIHNLKPLRNFKPETIDYIIEAVNHIPRRAKSITINYLLELTSCSKSYSYAHNSFAYHAYRYSSNLVQPQNFSYSEILEQIERENEEENFEIATKKTQQSEDQTKLIPFENFEIDKILSDIGKSENQFWKGLPMKKVVDHFIIMTTRKNKNGEPFLTNEQLISFLRKGFLNDVSQKQQKINCIVYEKGFVIKRFYQLYDLAVAQYGYPAKKAKFIKLFTDCFDNWDKDTVFTFFKPNKVKENW